MAAANYLAALWGFSLTIICLALLINKRSLKHIWHIAQDEVMLLFGGVMALVLGVASVLAFNVWDSTWTVIITLLGWATLIKGAVILFLPELTKKWYAKFEKRADILPVALVIGVILGCVLIYLGLSS